MLYFITFQISTNVKPVGILVAITPIVRTPLARLTVRAKEDTMAMDILVQVYTFDENILFSFTRVFCQYQLYKVLKQCYVSQHNSYKQFTLFNYYMYIVLHDQSLLNNSISYNCIFFWPYISIKLVHASFSLNIYSRFTLSLHFFTRRFVDNVISLVCMLRLNYVKHYL